MYARVAGLPAFLPFSTHFQAPETVRVSVRLLSAPTLVGSNPNAVGASNAPGATSPETLAWLAALPFQAGLMGLIDLSAAIVPISAIGWVMNVIVLALRFPLDGSSMPKNIFWGIK